MNAIQQLIEHWESERRKQLVKASEAQLDTVKQLYIYSANTYALVRRELLETLNNLGTEK